MMSDMGNFGGNMGWGMSFGWFFMVLFWALIILGVIAIVKWLSGGSVGAAGSQEKTTLDILKKRYARGEIDQEEYQMKKHDLEQQHDHPLYSL